MGLGNAAKDFVEEYRQRVSNNLKGFAERNETGFWRAAYQPYKWLVVLPLLAVSTFILGILAMLVSIWIVAWPMANRCSRSCVTRCRKSSPG